MTPWAYFRTQKHDLGENCGAEAAEQEMAEDMDMDEPEPFTVTRVTGQEECEDGFKFNEAACACFKLQECRVGCPGGYNNPFECGCLSRGNYWSIYDHNLDE